MAVTSLLNIAFWIGMLVFIHELGHFFMAKLSKVKVEQFSLGFPPKLAGFKWGETEYLISWVPWGGYVKMAGGEILEKDQPVQPGDFLSRPVWQRMLIAFSGPFMNFVLAWGLFSFIFFMGLKVPNYTTVLGDVPKGSPAYSAGLMKGDQVMEANGKAVALWNELDKALGRQAAGGLSRVARLKVKRGDRTLDVTVTPYQDPQSKEWLYGLEPFVPYSREISEVMVGLPAEVAGLKKGDKILEIDHVKMETWEQISETIHGTKGKPLFLMVERQGRPYGVTLTTIVQELPGAGMVGMIGIQPKVDSDLFFLEEFSAGEAVTQGAVMVLSGAGHVLGGLAQLVTGKVSFRDSAGGPITIVRMAGQQARQGWRELLNLVAMVSVMLGIINLMPIPMADGGLIFLFLIEVIFRRPLPVKVQAIYQRLGFAFILTLMLLVTYNDILKLIRSHFFPQIP